MPSATQAVLGIERAMVRDFNAGQIDRWLSHFHPRLVGFSSTGPERIAGKAAMARTFNYYRQASPEMRYRIRQPEVQTFDDTAVASFYWTVELGRGRPRHSIHGRASHVFHCQEGRWLIVHEHFSRAH